MISSVLLRNRLLLLGLLPAFVACGGGANPTPPVDGDDPGDLDVPVAIAAVGSAATFDVATWNIEWFGDDGNGPQDEVTQLRRVRDVINGAEIDLWGVQEIVDPADFATLLSELNGYSGLLANEASVVDGPANYNDFGGNEQKVGLIWRDSEFEVLSARVILAINNYEFAGRPPLEVRGRVKVGGVTEDVVVVVMHAKASTDEESWNRRQVAAAALKVWLDEAWPDEKIFVIGDFNDDIDTSIRVGNATPYLAFIEDGARWTFATSALTTAGATSTVNFSDMIDHLLVSNEAFARYETGSAGVYRLDGAISGYGNNTSDHYPVYARFTPGN